MFQKVKSNSFYSTGPQSEKGEITEMFIKQNDFVKRFAMANNINEHFKVLAIKSTKKNQNMFQVFASVSPILRDGIKQFKDKITLGLNNCKVYDQYHVKRCNKCQHFGHYIKIALPQIISVRNVVVTTNPIHVILHL